MTEDWAAVARAINERMAELGLTQLDLVERSHVSKTMVAELRHNTAQRRRSARTMEALSQALNWHPGHLYAVLRRERTPTVGEPLVRADDDTPGRLAAIEYRLTQMQQQLDELVDLVKRTSATNNESANHAPLSSESTGEGRPRWNR